MLHSTALRIAREHTADGDEVALGVVLAGRPRGVLHVVLAEHTQGQAARPVCGQRTRRLRRAGEGYSTTVLGGHQSGRPLCRRCAAWAGRRATSTTPPPLTAADAVLSVLATVDEAELNKVKLAVLEELPARQWTEIVPAPCGEEGAGRGLRFATWPGPLNFQRAVYRVREYHRAAPARAHREEIAEQFAAATAGSTP